MVKRSAWFGLMILILALAACSRSRPVVLRLATTTSTYDSGLLNTIIPAFEREYGVSVDILAVGTGQALALGENGDVDVLLVHSRAREQAFVSAGYGTQRTGVMYNDFILVGPIDDPAAVRGMALASQALTAIAQANAVFASRGDDSGTHSRELQLWAVAGIQPTSAEPWHEALGQGMGATLQFANERGAYTLTDRGTFLALWKSLPHLEIMVGGGSIAENADPDLLNPYGVIPISPERYPQTAADLAQQFVNWLTSLEIQEQIAAFGVDVYGQPLFYPDSQAWRVVQP
jgi:tungstate transport system substrate-binding protein